MTKKDREAGQLFQIKSNVARRKERHRDAAHNRKTDGQTENVINKFRGSNSVSQGQDLATLQLIYSWLSRCNTARGSCTRLFLVGPATVKARKSILFTEAQRAVWESKHH